MADGQQAIDLLREKFPDSVVDSGDYREQHWAEITSESLLDVCRWLREDPATDYDMLLDVTAVHWPDHARPIEVIYHFYSVGRNDRLRLKLRTGDRGPVPTLAGLWKSAEWNEREAFDMFGVQFEGHPDPRRILMPDDYTDYPLRKEFPLYRG